MDHFAYRDSSLFAEGVPLQAIADAVGTPTYVYARATLERHYRAFDDALAPVPHQVCYAVKANSNLAVLQLLARLGSGFDIVSGGELERVLRAGGAPEKIVFSGVGKTASELRRALEVGIGCFNVESEAELDLLAALAAESGQVAAIALRVNPDVDAQTHPYISTGLKENKFGVDIETAERLYERAAAHPALRVSGVASHIGSQLLKIAPYLDAMNRVLALVDRLAARGIVVDHLDVGGGLGIRYGDETPTEPAEWACAVVERLGDRPLKLYTEPGRAIAGNAGVLLTRVVLEKQTEVKTFLVVDAAMNDLLRPTLYNAWMDVVPVERGGAEARNVDVVGPVCESGDWIARSRSLSARAGDLLAVRGAGAYGFVMSSNYNSRGRAAEVLVDGERWQVVRARETFDDLIRNETLLDAGPT